MNTREAADYCGVTTNVLLYVARRDEIGQKIGGRWSFTFEELDRAFGGSAAFVARLRAEKEQLQEQLQEVSTKVAKELRDLATCEGPFNKMNKATARRLRQLADKLEKLAGE